MADGGREFVLQALQTLAFAHVLDMQNAHVIVHAELAEDGGAAFHGDLLLLGIEQLQGPVAVGCGVDGGQLDL